MKIILAGGTGLIGAALATRLVADGHELVVLTRNTKRTPAHGRRYVLWDGESSGPWEAELNGAAAVLNLAGESVGSRWTEAAKRRIVSSRTLATKAIVRALKSAGNGPTVFINASAVGYYGHVPEGDVTESSPAGEDFLGQTCLAWETEAATAAGLGVRVAMIRTGFVIAREAEAFRRMILPFRLFAGGPFGSGKQWFPWIHVHDVAEGYRFVLNNPGISGPVNLTSPNPVRVARLAKEIGKALHRPAFLPAPAFALKMILGEMSDLLLKGQRALPAKLLEHGFVFRYSLLEDALKAALGIGERGG